MDGAQVSEAEIVLQSTAAVGSQAEHQHVERTWEIAGQAGVAPCWSVFWRRSWL